MYRKTPFFFTNPDKRQTYFLPKCDMSVHLVCEAGHTSRWDNVAGSGTTSRVGPK